ncbi:MAG: hypothetical protein IJU83_04260 [Clostridia bacterium]|nr:hypothetical protein [Clostridia bacterium]
MKIKSEITKRIIALVCAFVFSCAYIGTAAFAWFADRKASNVNITGTAHRSYFEGGDGTSENPFIIARPIQLYYLAWLQELGYFNQTDENDAVVQTYFQVSADLNMSNYVLPPIGTAKNPFLGSFDGNGHKISNLTVKNDDSALTAVPQGDLETQVQIVGFFGVIGSMEEQGKWTKDTVEYTYDSSVNTVKNFLLDNVVVETTTPKDNKTLAGIAAGYVNADVSSVGVYNCKIQVGSGLSALDSENITDKISGYTLVGFSQAAYDAYIEKMGDEGNGWGGSLDMTSAHGRLATAFVTGSTTTNRVNYTYAKTNDLFYDKNGDSLGSTQTGTSTAYFKYKDYNSSGGSYLLAMRGQNKGSDRYFYLDGGVRITDTKYYYEDANGYYISDKTDSYYLQAQTGNGTSAGTVSQSTTEGTTWLYDGGAFYLEYVANKSTTAVKYYLGVDEYGRVNCTTTNAQWTVSGNNLYNGSNYLVHVNGNSGGWTATDNNALIKITDGTNYLGNITNATSVASTTAANAAEWAITGGYLHTVINGQNYYLNRNNATVSVSTTPNTTWSVSSSGIASGGYALRCTGGTWQATQTTSYITDGNGHYLTGNGSIGNSNSQNNASEWTMTATGNNYYISTTYNNNTYYLRNNGGTLQLTTGTNNITAWTVNGGVISNGDYQLTYDGGWDLSVATYYITDGNGHYLNHTSGNTISSGTSQNSATVWDVNANGRFSHDMSGSTYYLGYRNSSNPLVARTSVNAYYTLDANGRLSATYSSGWGGSTTYYIRYNNGWTTTTTANQAATITMISALPAIQIVPSASYLDNADVSYAGTQRTAETTQKYTSEVLPTYVDYTQGYATYMPLIVDNNDSTVAKSSNTGYIVGGSYDTTTGTQTTYPYGGGDIRISYYPISDNISNSYSNSNKTLDASKIYTINDSGTKTVSSIGAANFQKYTTAEAGFIDILKKDNTNVYGLHFMSAEISIDNLITASSVQINGEAYENYQLPASSIDFNLKQKGYINFFAGTYFSGNNSFFSLHRIFRNLSNEITAIKEILEIWGTDDENKLYVYKYAGGYEYSDGTACGANVPAGYTKMFDTTWIKRQASLQSSYIYYFEIPADEGEYALGSVPGGTGAYLLYLDISANAGDVDKEVMKYVQGVDFVTASDVSLLAAIADNNPTAAVGLKEIFSGNIGGITVSRSESDNVITFTITCTDTAVSTENLKEYVRYYYITPEGKEVQIVFVSQGS